jgi:prevent-host-death family protein
VKKKSKRTASLRARAARKPATKGAAKGWTLRAAKAGLSKLVRLAQKEPQRITRRGEDAVVVMSTADYDRLIQRQRKKTSLVEFLKSTGFGELDLERRFEPSRDIDL